MSAIRRRRSPCSGRKTTTARASRPRSRGRRCALSLTRLGRDAPTLAGTCSTGWMPRSGSPCSRWRPGRCASARRGSPRPRSRRRSGRGRGRRGSVARDQRRLIMRAVRLGRRARGQPTAADVPVFRPFMLAHPLEETRVDIKRLCRRVEMGRHPRPDRPCRRRDSALFAARATTSPAAFPSGERHRDAPGVLDGELMVKRRIQGGQRRRARRRGELQRAPAAAGAQDRVGQDADRLSRVRAALRHPVRRTRICARSLDRAPRTARGLRAAPRPRPLRRQRVIDAKPSKRWRKSAPAPATPRSRA
jgi:hypothetical protein